MAYSVKEIFKTIQGEGANAGRVAVFCRFAGCNLWSGREEDRAEAVCKFCDTDFVGGEKFASAQDLAAAIEREWGADAAGRMVVITGGEPALQYDAALADALHARGFFVAIETNGTIPLAAPADWICVSPKAGTEIKQTRADELKVVYPQEQDVEAVARLVAAPVRSLQPKDGADADAHLAATIAYCLAHPHWRLSLQTHKYAGIR